MEKKVNQIKFYKNIIYLRLWQWVSASGWGGVYQRGQTGPVVLRHTQLLLKCFQIVGTPQ